MAERPTVLALVRHSLVSQRDWLPVHAIVLLASTVGAVVSWWIPVVGIGAEVVFHAARAATPGFRQRMVLDEHRRRREREVQALRPDEQLRLLRVEAQCEALSRSGWAGRLQADGLAELAALFRGLLVSRNALTARGGPDPAAARHALENQLADAARRLEGGPDEPTRASLEATVALLGQRLELADRSAAKVAHIDAELGRIEHQIGVIADEAALSGGTSALAERVDAVVWTLDATRDWLRDLQRDDHTTSGAAAAGTRRDE